MSEVYHPNKKITRKTLLKCNKVELRKKLIGTKNEVLKL